MAFGQTRYDRMEIDLLMYHYPKPGSGEGGAMTQEARAIDLTQVVKDLGLKGREAMIQRAYAKFGRDGLMVRSGFGYKMTEKGIKFITEYKKLYQSM